MTERMFAGGPPKPEDSLELLPCPFCGSRSIDPAGWASHDDHGPACDDCGGAAQTVALWNSRPEPVAPKSNGGRWVEAAVQRRTEAIARLSQERLPLCNDGWELQ